jgi:hypothetical protein
MRIGGGAGDASAWLCSGGAAVGAAGDAQRTWSTSGQ